MEKNIRQAKKRGLVLSGGGVKGLAHVGVLKALAAWDIDITHISGASAGALVGALHAGGNSPEDILRFFKETPLFSYSFFTFYKPGLLNSERYMDIFMRYLPTDTFEGLDRKLFVATTNLEMGCSAIFHQGTLIRPVLASAALPPVFSPIEINGELHADGGILNNFPVEPLPDYCDYIIGSNVVSVRPVTQKEITSSLQLTNRVTTLMMHAGEHLDYAKCDLLLQPEGLENVGLLDKKGIEKAYTLGYDYTMTKLEAMLAIP